MDVIAIFDRYSYVPAGDGILECIVSIPDGHEPFKTFDLWIKNRSVELGRTEESMRNAFSYQCRRLVILKPTTSQDVSDANFWEQF